MADMSVTNFVGTGTITYTLATDGATDITGTFTATGTNLLTGNLLVASADTTYTLTLTADAAITYTIMGTKKVDYPEAPIYSTLRQYPPDYVDSSSHSVSSTQPQNGIGGSDYAYTKGHQRKVVVSGQSYGNGDYYFTGVSHSNKATAPSETAFISNLTSQFWYIDARYSSAAASSVYIYPNPNSGEGSSPMGNAGIAWQQIKMPTSIILQKVELYYTDQSKMELYIYGTN